MSDQDTISSTWGTTDLESNAFLPEKSLPVLPKRTENVLQLLRKRPIRNSAGWRPVMICGCTGTTFAFICNIAILIWASTKPNSISNTFVLYDGDCESTRLITTWSHLGINIFSSLILASSNYAMQILMAPTRDSINLAHKKQRSVAIGIPSLKNWTYMSGRKQLLYLGLLLTSIPFHTIYNSVIYDTISAVDVGMYLVTENFVDNLPWLIKSSGFLSRQALPMWEGVLSQNWNSLTAEDCCRAFSSYYVHDYKNVVLVTEPFEEIYGYMELGNTTRSSQSSSASWWLNCTSLQNSDESLLGVWNISFWDSALDKESSIGVQRCLAEPTRVSCTVELSPQLLGVAIACNAIKVAILVSLLLSAFAPMVTIGDAIASFIDEPDPTTKGWGAISAEDLCEHPPLEPVSQSVLKPASAPVYSPWLPPSFITIETPKVLRGQSWSNRSRYSLGATSSHWRWTMFFCLSYLVFGVAMALKSSLMNRTEELQTIWQDGLGSVVPQRLEAWHLGFFGTVIVINLPQLFLSLTYLSYNSLLTSMLLSQEWTNYALYRKGLRVTKPEGEQRSTYFLSLPYRYSIPSLIASALLHWSLSQSLFFAQVNFTNSDGLPDPDLSVLSAGYSIIGLLVALPIGFTMMVALILLGFRRYNSGIPLVISDSRAISAACHPVAQIDLENRPSLKTLKYGVVADLGQGRYHVGFSSGPVEPLKKGEFYNYRELHIRQELNNQSTE